MKASPSGEINHVYNPQHSWRVRVYYEDTDAGGVVYHTNYLKFMERARSEWLRSAGFSQPGLVAKYGVVFVVAGLSVEFLVPARFDESLDVNSRILDAGRSRIQFEQNIVGPDGELKCTAEINIVCVDSMTFRPKRIPEQIKAKLTNDS